MVHGSLLFVAVTMVDTCCAHLFGGEMHEKPFAVKLRGTNKSLLHKKAQKQIAVPQRRSRK